LEVLLNDLTEELGDIPVPSMDYWLGYVNASPAVYTQFLPMLAYKGDSANGVVINVTVDNLHVLDPGVVQWRHVVIDG